MLLKRRNKPSVILVYPDERLKLIAEPVDFNKTSLKARTKMVLRMGSALQEMDWGKQLGLAAPQIGLNKRIIICRGNVMFNPEWNPSKAPLESFFEACYSVPGKMFKVPRDKSGWAKWTDINGRPCEDKLNGIPAIIFQHELDHLNGKCCIDVGTEIEKKD